MLVGSLSLFKSVQVDMFQSLIEYTTTKPDQGFVPDSNIIILLGVYDM